MTFIWFDHTAPQMREAYALRQEVFTQEQGFRAADDLDGMDAQAQHVLVLDEQGAPLATGRMFPEAGNAYHLGRIAVRKALRGAGIGRALMDEMAQRAKALGAQAVTVGAQFDKADFYAKCGFERTGHEFKDAGYPHVEMRRAL